ncbi:MAG: T9SS type A sorting domain-containing protein, partial [Flavobacteriales bacterium]|nr:T9SS type A sorting domain-containing protein [Flavobacteriales bacterium]
NVSTYFIDDVSISTAVPSTIVTPEALTFNFGPNPATNYINIQGQPADAQLKIHALNGQLVHTQKVTSLDRGQRIELNLDNGIYFVELSNGGLRSTQRLVVQQ